MAKVFKAKRVLYFIEGPMPSEDDKAGAAELAGQGFDVAFRNAILVSDSEAVEQFDDVAGAVPPAYERAKAAKEEAANAAKFALFDPDGDGRPGGAPKGGNKSKKDAKGGKGTSGKPEEPPPPPPPPAPAPAATETPPGAPPAPADGQQGGQGAWTPPGGPAAPAAAPGTPPAPGAPAWTPNS